MRILRTALTGGPGPDNSTMSAVLGAIAVAANATWLLLGALVFVNSVIGEPAWAVAVLSVMLVLTALLSSALIVLRSHPVLMPPGRLRFLRVVALFLNLFAGASLFGSISAQSPEEARIPLWVAYVAAWVVAVVLNLIVVLLHWRSEQRTRESGTGS